MTDHQTPHARMITLPADLERAIDRALSSVSSVRWIRAAQALSERYRSDRTANAAPLATGREQALGYAALIMPATFAQLWGAITATAARIHGWQPRTLLDLGSGPGTALWAAAQRWPSLETFAASEREPALIALGRELARSSDSAAMRNAQWDRRDLRHLPADRSDQFDLVVIGHVLNELDPATQQQVIDWAWQRTAGVLLVVEPGTSAAFPLVRAARDRLLDQRAHTVAPCVHDQPCPLQNDWCHFPQRLKRPPFQRQARGAPSEWEDSKFCYAAMSRFAPFDPLYARVIRETVSNKAYAETKVSSRDGIIRVRGLKRHKNAYRHVRSIAWGATLAAPLADPIETTVLDPLAPHPFDPSD